MFGCEQRLKEAEERLDTLEGKCSDCTVVEVTANTFNGLHDTMDSIIAMLKKYAPLYNGFTLNTFVESRGVYRGVLSLKFIKKEHTNG